MVGHLPGSYGESVGDNYDSLYPGIADEMNAAIDLIVALAMARPERSVLELGVGTGRLALRLVEAGLQVAGIDESSRMMSKLRAKPRGDEIDLVEGDYRDAVAKSGPFSVVLLVFNGIFDPRGLRTQLDIFRNAARHISEGGFFVVESWVMNDTQRNGNWSVVPRYVTGKHVELQMARYCLSENTIERTLVHLREGGQVNFVNVKDTYASPGELDVMAEVTGFERMVRYGGWNQCEFTIASASHVTVYRRVSV